jgi:hypothetical protein
MAIFLILTQQTLPPDEVHLWLALPQFPHKEADLPGDLRKILEHPKITLHWTEKDTYCHKRHEIFKYTNSTDRVYIIDDDTYYDSKLIETVELTHKQHPNCIVCYNVSGRHNYIGKHILYYDTPVGGPYVNLGRINGNCMFPAGIVPIEIYDPNYIKIRDELTPICDETWITPWLVYYDVPIYYHAFGWGNEINPAYCKMTNGLVSQTHVIETNGLERRDNWLSAILDKFPLIKSKYVNLFAYGI